MPRVHDPHWGEDGFHEPERFVVSHNDALAIAAMVSAPAVPETVALFRAELERIALQYWRWRRRGAAAFERGEARAALEKLLKWKRIQSSVLPETLNTRAFVVLLDELCVLGPALDGPGDSVFRALMDDRIDQAILRDAADSAIAKLKDTKGPDPDAELAWAVDELCSLFRALSGKQPTHSQKGRLFEYDPGSRSEAGRFVAACFERIDPDVRNTQISTALRKHIKARRSSG